MTSCKKDSVPDISEDFPTTKEFKEILQKLNKFHQDFEEIKHKLYANMWIHHTALFSIKLHLSASRSMVILAR